MTKTLEGTVTVSSAGTAEKITTDNGLTHFDKAKVKVITFRARAGNTGVAYIGGSAVASTRGMEVPSGGVRVIEYGNGSVELGSWFVDAATSADKVDWLAILE